MNERTITVKGVGSVSKKPDLIVVTMNLETTENDYRKTMLKASDELEKIKNAAASAGHQKDKVKTASFNIDSHYESERDDNGNWKQVFAGYKCRHALKLEFDLDMELLGKTLGAISSSKVEPRLKIAFSLKDTAAVSAELLENAVKNAREKASVLAKASGVNLGEIISIDYNWGELYLNSNTEYADNLRCFSACADEVSVDIEPEDINANDSVTVVWSIK